MRAPLTAFHHIEPAPIDTAKRDLVIPAIAAHARHKAEFARCLVRTFLAKCQSPAQHAPAARTGPARLLRRFRDRYIVRRGHAARQEEIFEFPEARGACLRRLSHRRDAPDDGLHPLETERPINPEMRAREIVEQEIGKNGHVAPAAENPFELTGREALREIVLLRVDRECLRRWALVPKGGMSIAEIVAGGFDSRR